MTDCYFGTLMKIKDKKHAKYIVPDRESNRSEGKSDFRQQFFIF